MSEKKRKRSAPDDEQASPKRRASLRVMHLDIAHGLSPVLVETPGIEAPPIGFTPYAHPRDAKHPGSDAIKPTSHRVILHSSQHPRLDYTASPASSDHLTHYLAVLDPATNQLCVVPAHHLTLRSALRSETQESEDHRAKRTNVQQREALGREFGTKKAKKAIEGKTINAITQSATGKDKITDIQNAILDNVADATAANASAAQQATALLASKPIPKPNLAAETVEDVYPLSTLIPAAESRLVPIKDWQDKTRADEPISFSHRFPAFRVSPIGKSDHVDKLKALAYLTVLLDFHATLSNAGRSGGRKIPKKDALGKALAAWPQPLVDSVRRRFADSSGSAMGKWQTDNFYTHICALSLYVDGWKTDMSQLREDLKVLEQKQLSTYFVELGCKVGPPTEAEKTALGISKAQAAGSKMARLKLPLEFPKPRMGRRI